MQEKIVKIIEPEEKTYLIDNIDKPISVCAYCRVSTDKNDQRNSFESQQQFFSETFKKHPNWIKKTIFADKGISGTSLKKRDEFNNMISSAMHGNYQLIITKEVSRFSRNVKDILNIVTELHNKGVYIWFLTDDINTEEADYRDKLIEAGKQAEAESRKTSKRVRWGQKRQMENGVVFGRKEMYGYNIKRDENNKQYFEIIPEEAEIIKRVFLMYASGMGTFQIARKLEQEGIKTKRYKNGWSNTVILRMLRNEKYVGDLLTGKTYTPDFLTHEKKYNRRESDIVEIINHHPEAAIIDRDLWNKVQKLLEENSPSDEVKAKHSNRYWCSGKVFCGACGERYVSRSKTLKNGETYKCWTCWENQQHGGYKERILDNGEKLTVGCNAKSVNDKVLRQGVYDIITAIIKPNFESIYSYIKQEAESDFKSDKSDIEVEIEKLRQEEAECQNTIADLTLKLLDGKIPELAYKLTIKNKEEQLQKINNKIASLNERKASEIDASHLLSDRLAKLQSILDLKENEINDFLFRDIVDKIEVYENNILKFYVFSMDEPVVMKYKSSGKMDKYNIEFYVLEYFGINNC